MHEAESGFLSQTHEPEAAVHDTGGGVPRAQSVRQGGNTPSGTSKGSQKLGKCGCSERRKNRDGVDLDDPDPTRGCICVPGVSCRTGVLGQERLFSSVGVGDTIWGLLFIKVRGK